MLVPLSTPLRLLAVSVLVTSTVAISQENRGGPQRPEARPAPGGPQRPGDGPGNRPGNPGGGRPDPGNGNPPPRPNPGNGGPQIQPVRPQPVRPQPPRPGPGTPGGPQIQPVRPQPVRPPQPPPRPGGGNNTRPPRPGNGRPPQWGRPPQNRPNYHFRPGDRDILRRHYLARLRYINRARRPVFTVGSYFPLAYIGYLSSVPPSLYGSFPPPPPGYRVGYFDGYVVVYDPLTYFIADLVDLLQ